MQSIQTSHRRRWIMPLFVLVIAAALAWWGSHRNAATNLQVQEQVLQICKAAASGEDLTGRLNPADPFSESQTIQQLQRVCASPQAIAKLQIVITPGDAPFVRDQNSPATHTALLKLNGVDELGLRVRSIAPNDIRILGYWLPKELHSPS